MIKKRGKLFIVSLVFSLLGGTLVEAGISIKTSVLQELAVNPDVHFWIWITVFLFIIVMIRACGYVE